MKITPYRASKWLEIHVLLESDEMGRMLAMLDPACRFYLVGTILKPQEGIITLDQFLENYSLYIEALRQGKEPLDANHRRPFSSALSVSENMLTREEVSPGETLLRNRGPVIQLRPHRFSYSTMDGKYRSMVLGTETISWGIQLAYPQLCQLPGDVTVHNVNEQFPNTAVFKQLQRWVRHNTIPTPLEAAGVRTNVPIRLGKNCLPWIHKHPHLIQQNITVGISTP